MKYSSLNQPLKEDQMTLKDLSQQATSTGEHGVNQTMDKLSNVKLLTGQEV